MALNILKPAPENYQFDEMTAEERSKVWVGHRAQWGTRLRGLHLPKRFENAKMSDFKFGSELDNAALFISGSTGVGKTHLLAALAKRQLTIGCNSRTKSDDITQEEISYAKFISIVNLLVMFRGTMNNQSSMTEASLFAEYAHAEFLFLDDLGVQKESDWVSETVYRIIDYRYANMLPTCITSNLTIAEIEKQNMRIASRIMGMCEILELKGSDRRYDI